VFEERPVPEPQDGEVLIRIGYAGVNPADSKARSARGLEQVRDAINLRNRDNRKLQRKRSIRDAFQSGQNLGQSTGNGAVAEAVNA